MPIRPRRSTYAAVVPPHDCGGEIIPARRSRLLTLFSAESSRNHLPILMSKHSADDLTTQKNEERKEEQPLNRLDGRISRRVGISTKRGLVFSSTYTICLNSIPTPVSESVGFGFDSLKQPSPLLRSQERIVAA